MVRSAWLSVRLICIYSVAKDILCDIHSRRAPRVIHRHLYNTIKMFLLKTPTQTLLIHRTSSGIRESHMCTIFLRDIKVQTTSPFPALTSGELITKNHRLESMIFCVSFLVCIFLSYGLTDTRVPCVLVASLPRTRNQLPA
jgi:hypothetical protein